MVSIEKTWIWKSFRRGVRCYKFSRKSALKDALVCRDISEFVRNELKQQQQQTPQQQPLGVAWTLSNQQTTTATTQCWWDVSNQQTTTVTHRCCLDIKQPTNNSSNPSNPSNQYASLIQRRACTYRRFKH